MINLICWICNDELVWTDDDGKALTDEDGSKSCYQCYLEAEAAKEESQNEFG